MYFDNAEGMVFRPPSEANSFILRLTVGCSHNECTYCNMYKAVKFRIRSMEEIMRQVDDAQPYARFIRRIFLADGNALVLSTDRLLEILAVLKEKFPKLTRVSCYAGPKDILQKTAEELERLFQAGLKLVYYGMESGDDAVLSHVRKGVTAAQAITAGQRVVAAGMKLSLMVIAGLAGKAGSKCHAYHTAQAINAIRPNMLSVLTLMLYKGSQLCAEYESGSFAALAPAEILAEIQELLYHIHLPTESHCLFRSTHASNYVALSGTLPQDKEKLLLVSNQAMESFTALTDWDVYNNVE